jgi:hypothetical protein
VEYPRADGGKIAVMVSMIRDPNGYWLEINQLLNAPAKASYLIVRALITPSQIM